VDGDDVSAGLGEVSHAKLGLHDHLPTRWPHVYRSDYVRLGHRE
jgi:hypothetical protein